MKNTRIFRATFVDNFSQNTIVVEFDAPFPVDEQNVDYEKLSHPKVGRDDTKRTNQNS